MNQVLAVAHRQAFCRLLRRELVLVIAFSSVVDGATLVRCEATQDGQSPRLILRSLVQVLFAGRQGSLVHAALVVEELLGCVATVKRGKEPTLSHLLRPESLLRGRA